MVSVALNPDKAGAPPPKELVEAEFEAVRTHYMDGVLRQVWLRADGSGGIILAEAAYAEAVAETFATLPMVRAGVLGAPDIVQLAPCWGFAPRGCTSLAPDGAEALFPKTFRGFRHAHLRLFRPAQKPQRRPERPDRSTIGRRHSEATGAPSFFSCGRTPCGPGRDGAGCPRMTASAPSSPPTS